jgi:hypothetical protein
MPDEPNRNPGLCYSGRRMLSVCVALPTRTCFCILSAKFRRNVGEEGIPREQKTSVKIALSSRQARGGSRRGMCRKVRQKLGVLRTVRQHSRWKANAPGQTPCKCRHVSTLSRCGSGGYQNVARVERQRFPRSTRCVVAQDAQDHEVAWGVGLTVSVVCPAGFPHQAGLRGESREDHRTLKRDDRPIAVASLISSPGPRTTVPRHG